MGVFLIDMCVYTIVCVYIYMDMYTYTHTFTCLYRHMYVNSVTSVVFRFNLFSSEHCELPFRT